MLVPRLNKRNGKDINFKKMYNHRGKKINLKKDSKKTPKAFDARGIRAKNRCFLKHIIER